MYKTDYHIHTIYSDGRSNFNDYVNCARSLGFKEIGFSDHISFDDSNNSMSINHRLLIEYIEELIKIRNDNLDLKIRIGFEVDYTIKSEEKIRSVLQALPVDYLIGSVHNISSGAVDANPDFYKNGNITQIWAEYFEIVEKAIDSKLFNFIGHLDLVRIFNFSPKTNLSDIYGRIAKKLCSKNIAIELNTNGMNKILKSFYPDKNYLRIFFEEGVPICVNSDAHKTSELGQYFEKAYQLIRYVGYTKKVIFSNRKMEFVNI